MKRSPRLCSVACNSTYVQGLGFRALAGSGSCSG